MRTKVKTLQHNRLN